MDIKPASSIPLDALALLFNDAFAHYFVPINLDAETLADWISREGVDMELSKIFEQDGKPVGFGFIARRANASRLVAMGVAQSTAGQGLGTAALAHLIEDARQRGDTSIELEAVEKNDRAVKMYKCAGFEIERLLVGWECDSPRIPDSVSAGPDSLKTVSLSEAGEFVTKHARADLPWQASGRSAINRDLSSVAYRLGNALAIISTPEAPEIKIHSLIVAPDHRQQGEATRLVGEVLRKHPGKKWTARQLFPEDVEKLANKFGFVRLPLYQVHMRRHLDPPPS